MKALFGKEDYKYIYELTSETTPLNSDCGKLCDEICCRVEDGYGIYLLPGEQTIFSKEESWFEWSVQDACNQAFPESWEGDVYFLSCKGKCKRDKRPMQCRTYPVAPHLSRDGKFQLIIETLDTSYSCPLIKDEKYLNQFSEEWLHNLYVAWGMLLNDPLIYDLVQMDSEDRMNKKLKIIKAYG